MDAKEIITRERIALRELKAAVIGQIEREIGKTIERLDDLELRIEKESLTGGEATFKMADPAASRDPQIPDAADIVPSLNGKAAK
jgi:hypothetical protein